MTERSLSGRDVAAAVGVHEATVSGWLNNRRQPERAALRTMAELPQVDLSWLAFGEEGPSAPASPPVRVPAVPPGASAAIATGQRDLAAWLADFSARLLEAAAADARRQLAGVVSWGAFTPDLAGGVPAELPHAGGTPEQKAALDRTVIEQLGGAGKKKRSAG